MNLLKPGGLAARSSWTVGRRAGSDSRPGRQPRADRELCGRLTREPVGDGGFGYDPIVEVSGRTLAQYLRRRRTPSATAAKPYGRSPPTRHRPRFLRKILSVSRVAETLGSAQRHANPIFQLRVFCGVSVSCHGRSDTSGALKLPLYFHSAMAPRGEDGRRHFHPRGVLFTGSPRREASE
jgi:hypothetical protein